MKELKKIWFCLSCGQLTITKWNDNPSGCIACGNADLKFIPPLFGDMQKVAVPISKIKVGDVEYQFIKDIGSGGFGTVYVVKVENSPDTHYYALKVPNSFQAVVNAVQSSSKLSEHNRGKLAKQNKSILREVKIFAKHQFSGMMPIVDFGEFTLGEYPIQFFVQELGYISLFKLMEEINGLQKKLAPELRYAIAYEIVKSVADAHRQGVLLADLSMENVVLYISDNGALLPGMIDFGGAKTQTLSNTIDTYREHYLPVELQIIKNPKRDVFNLGVLVFEILAAVPSWLNIHTTEDFIGRDVVNIALKDFPETIISKFAYLLDEIEEHPRIIEVLKTATDLQKIYPSAKEFLDELPVPKQELNRQIIQKTIKWWISLNKKDDAEKTQHLINIDSLLKNDIIELADVYAFRSNNYNIKLPFSSEVFQIYNNRILRFEPEKTGTKILSDLKAKVYFEFDVFLEE